MTLSVNNIPTSSPLRDDLTAAIHFCYQRGWAAGTGGNFSAVQSRSPLRLLITPSGVDKGKVTGEELLEIDAAGMVFSGNGAASAETQLHLAIVACRDAGSVLHTHTVWNTLLSRRHAEEGELTIQGYEMLKGLRGVTTHEHRERVPILQNSQDMAALSRELTDVLARYPECHGVLLAGHGLYTWGSNVFEARRHMEIFEFLFEVVGREHLWQS
jgi:methylthioribulose-1-phosphate dehydratase